MLARIVVLGVALFTTLAPSVARAHQDPAGCFVVGAALAVQTFRSDGVTGVVGAITDCEQIFYRVSLSKALPSDPSACAVSGGTLSLTTPDGVVHSIDASVPCLGGTSGLEGCTSGVDVDQSGLISYTASPADVTSGFVTAHADYAGGTAHDSPANTPGVSATTPKATPIGGTCATTTTTTTAPPTTTTTLLQSTCAAVKIVAATKLSLALSKCDAKAVKTGAAVLQACRDKAFAKFTTKWASAETKTDCVTTGDAMAIQNQVDDCAASITSSLLP